MYMTNLRVVFFDMMKIIIHFPNLTQITVIGVSLGFMTKTMVFPL